MAGRLDVITYGKGDTYLTVDPDMTFFHRRVTKRPNFAINYVDLKVKKDDFGFGKTVRFTIPQNIGHLLKGVSLNIKADDIPDEWNLYYQDGVGVGVIEYADLIIGDSIIERLDSNYITIEKSYFNNSRQQETVEELTGLIPQTQFSGWYGCRKSFSQKHTQKEFDYIVDLPFYFYKNPELAIPLCAITKQEVEIEIKFRDLKDVLFSKTVDLYDEECVDFPIPTYYNNQWIKRRSIIYEELIKGYLRTVYSKYKYDGVQWYENDGEPIGGAHIGQWGLGIHKYSSEQTFKLRDYYPYSDTGAAPTWSIADFLQDQGGFTYDVGDYALKTWTPEMWARTNAMKVFYHSFPFLNKASVNMRLFIGNTEFSKDATIHNPYQSVSSLENVAGDLDRRCSFMQYEKTSPTLLNTVYNYQIESVYGGSDNPFQDINKENEVSVPINWEDHGRIIIANWYGRTMSVLTSGNAPTVLGALPNSITAGFIRVYSHHPVGENWNVKWDRTGVINQEHITEIEGIERNTLPSDFQTIGWLELHFPMHSNVTVGDRQYIDRKSEVVPFNQQGRIYLDDQKRLGSEMVISSAGKAIVATLGNPDYPRSLRIYTWYPNKKLGGEHVPGYSAFHDDPNYDDWKRTDVYGEEFLITFPNSVIDLNTPTRDSPTSRAISRTVMSDYWETTDFSGSFLEGRTAIQDNGHFALFWGHVRNITIAHSYIADGNSTLRLGSVRIYEWDFNNWNTYSEWKNDWTKDFTLKQTIDPPYNTPTYNFNFGERICISRNSQTLIVSEPDWVPPNRQSITKNQNYNWHVGRIHVYKKDSSGEYQHDQTIYPELPSLQDRLKHAQDYNHPLYTSWDDPIQKRWEFGRSMQLSNDDKTLIVGATSNTGIGPNESPEGTAGGWVSIYQLNTTGDFEFKSFINRGIDQASGGGFGVNTTALTSDGNDIVISADFAEWDPDSELPFPDSSYDPLASFANSTSNQDCGSLHLFSRDTLTPRTYNDVNLNMKECKLNLELVYLDKVEQIKLRNTQTNHIITQLQLNRFNWQEYEGSYYGSNYIQKTQKNRFKLNFCNPVKQLYIVTKKDNTRSLELLNDSNTVTSGVNFFQGVTDFDGFVRNYGNRETNTVYASNSYSQPVMESIKSLSLTLDEDDVIPSDAIGEFPSHYLRSIPCSKYHTHSALNRRMYTWSFCLQPESWKPTGQLNFSNIKNQFLNLEGYKTGWSHKHNVFIYAKSYNVLRIECGTAKLLYPLVANGLNKHIKEIDDFSRPSTGDFTLLGNSLVLHERYQTYTDAGYTYSGDDIVGTFNHVDIDNMGTYTVDYRITDEHGRYVSISRTVVVTDTVAPIITLLSGNNLDVRLGYTDFTDPGATVDTGESYSVTGTYDVNTLGTYQLVYSATDDGGNTGQATRTINVVNDVAPSLTLLGSNPVQLIECDTFSDPGYIVGNQYTTEPVVDSSQVDTSTVGNYDVTYTSSSNIIGTNYSSVSFTRTVSIIPLTVTLNYSPTDGTTHAMNIFEPWIDPGYTTNGTVSSSVSATTDLGGTNGNVYRNTISYTPTCNDNERASRTVKRSGERARVRRYGGGNGYTNDYNTVVYEKITLIGNCTINGSNSSNPPGNNQWIFWTGTNNGGVLVRVDNNKINVRVAYGALFTSYYNPSPECDMSWNIPANYENQRLTIVVSAQRTTSSDGKALLRIYTNDGTDSDFDPNSLTSDGYALVHTQTQNITTWGGSYLSYMFTAPGGTYGVVQPLRTSSNQPSMHRVSCQSSTGVGLWTSGANGPTSNRCTVATFRNSLFDYM